MPPKFKALEKECTSEGDPRHSSNLQGLLGIWPLEIAGGWAELATLNYVLWGPGMCLCHSRELGLNTHERSERVGPGQPLLKCHTVNIQPGVQIQGHGFQSLSSGDTGRMSALQLQRDPDFVTCSSHTLSVELRAVRRGGPGPQKLLPTPRPSRSGHQWLKETSRLSSQLWALGQTGRGEGAGRCCC